MVSDKELNEWLAVEVMGWKKQLYHPLTEDGFSVAMDEWDWYKYETENEPVYKKDWNPCTDLNQAWACVIETAKKYPTWDLGVYKIVRGDKICASAWIDKYGTDIKSDTEIENISPARAICEAIYMAKKDNKPDDAFLIATPFYD